LYSNLSILCLSSSPLSLLSFLSNPLPFPRFSFHQGWVVAK
jgi:hypothetical protein